MKIKIINLIIIVVFLVMLFNFDYLLIFLGKLNSNEIIVDSVKISTLTMENRQLKQELNDTLELNELDKYTDYDLVKSNILVRDPYNFTKQITIRYGKDKKLKEGMAVVSNNGLLGIISKVNKKSSIVKLLTNNDINVSIKIDDNYGMLKKYDFSNNVIVGGNFNNYEIIMKNDEVYTSGLGLIPEGIYIGSVVSTKNNNVEQSIMIKSNNNFNNIKYVGIIRGLKNL